MRPLPPSSSRRAVGLLLAALAAGVHGADPPRPADQERARAARAAGEALPLARIQALVEARLPGGRAIEVELERDGGRLVYELDWLLPDGRVIELTLDARSGEWLQVEGARLETLFARPPSGAASR